MQCHEDRVPVLKIPEAASSSKVLAAASKATLASLPHEQLVAAFDRVAAGIDSWQQLAPVLEEEGSWDCQEYEGGGTLGGQQKGHGGGDKAAYPGEEAETIEDKTFLTGKLLIANPQGLETTKPAVAVQQVQACNEMSPSRCSVLGQQVSPQAALQVLQVLLKS